MKVAIVSSEALAGRGGIQRTILYFLRYLRRAQIGHHVDVYRTRWGSVRPIQHATTPIFLLLTIGRLLLGGYDLVHVNVAPRGSTYRKLIICAVLQVFRIPFIVHLHGSGYDDFYARQGARLQGRIQSMLRAAARVVVLGEYWKNFVLYQVGVDASRLRVIPNGVPDVAAGAATKAATDTVTSIATFGAVGPRKGTDILIEALAGLADDPSWRAIIGGDGDLAQFRSAAQHRGIADRVSFLGWVDETDVISTLAAASLYVLPSRFENAPLSILEAMAAGLPVVATQVGSVPEQVKDGVTGILVPSGDAVALRTAIGQLLRDPVRRREMGSRGRLLYEQEFSIDAYGRRMVSLYEEAIRSDRPSSQ